MTKIEHLSTDCQRRTLLSEKRKSRMGNTENPPKSSACDESAKIKSHLLDVEHRGRLTFLISASLKFGTF
jgi:hypothetical protein